MKEIVIPQMGESITEVQIGQLLVKPEAFVKEGDEIIEIETEKVNQLLYATSSGILSWKVKTGDTVKVGAVVATISEAVSNVQPIENGAQTKVESAPEKDEPLPLPSTGAVRKDAGDFLKEIDKTITTAKSAPSQREAKEERRSMSPIRQAISERLVRAKSETAMLTTFNEVDMTHVIEIREKYGELFKKKYSVKLGFLSFFVKAVIASLRQYPIIGSMIEGKEIVKREPLDIGIAVSTDRGLVVPVLRNPEALTFSEIESGIELLAKKAREGGLSLDDLRGGVFTITNGGIFGSLLSTPIVNYPQSAILGLHKIEKRCVAIHDEVKIRSMMYLAMSYDHRLIDGREAVQFLVRIKELLEDPERMLFQI